MKRKAAPLKSDVLTPKGTIKAWSLSRLNDYRACPRLAMLKHVNGMKEPGNEAMQRGSKLGKDAEDYIRGTLKKLPPELQSFKAELAELKKRKAVTEENWAFDENWNETGWFDRNAWCRMKTDYYVLDYKVNNLVVIDGKTGKVRESHNEQVKLYALGGLLKFPTVDQVDARLWYFDQGLELPEEPEIYTRDDVPKLKTYWMKEVKPMLSDTRFAPKPSNNCRWCFFSKGKGGPCEF